MLPSIVDTSNKHIVKNFTGHQLLVQPITCFKIIFLLAQLRTTIMMIHSLLLQLVKDLVSLDLEIFDGFVKSITDVLFLVVLKLRIIKLGLSRINKMGNVHVLEILLVYFIFLLLQFLTQLLIGGHFSFTNVLSFSDLI